MSFYDSTSITYTLTFTDPFTRRDTKHITVYLRVTQGVCGITFVICVIALFLSCVPVKMFWSIFVTNGRFGKNPAHCCEKEESVYLTDLLFTHRAMHPKGIAHLYFWNIQYRHKHFGPGGPSAIAFPREPHYAGKNRDGGALFFRRYFPQADN